MFRAFYSDPHFGHKNIIPYCERPFSDIDDMHEGLIARYNAVIRPDDWVLWLGDCSMYLSTHEMGLILASLNGKKALVIGNHDRSKAAMAKLGFAFVVDQLQMDIGGTKVIASHYPYAETQKRDGKVDLRYPERRPERIKGQVLMHGHTHSHRRRNGSMIHVGVDAWDYAPALLEDVESLVAEVRGEP